MPVCVWRSTRAQVEADWLFLLTDVDALYTADPVRWLCSLKLRVLSVAR